MSSITVLTSKLVLTSAAVLKSTAAHVNAMHGSVNMSMRPRHTSGLLYSDYNVSYMVVQGGDSCRVISMVRQRRSPQPGSDPEIAEATQQSVSAQQHHCIHPLPV